MNRRGGTALGALSALALAGVLAQPACGRQQARQEPAAAQAAADSAQAVAEREATAWRQRVGQARQRLAAAPRDAGLRRELSRLLLRVGQADEAVRVASEGGVEQANVLGEALYARGRVAEAEAAFRRAISGGARDSVEARVNLGVLLWRRGEQAAAREELERVVDVVTRATEPSSAELTALGTALRYLGEDDSRLFQEAVRAYERAVRLDADNDDARLAEAALFLDKYNSTDAQDLIREVLQREPGRPEALLLQAQARKFDGSDEALALVRHALTVAPDYAPAHVFLAELQLGLEDFQAASAEVARALELDPASLDALAIQAAVQRLQGDERGFDQTARRALALDARFSGLYVTAAEMAVQQRRYGEAEALARRALALDSSDWSAWAELGMNQFRLGDIAGARLSLERSFKGDPYNVWVDNTLKLLDTYPEYVNRTAPRLRFFLHRDEADLLALYMVPLAEEAFDSLSRHYEYRPDSIQVEVFPRHADFSVRTVGLTGLGALGVSFGDQLAMDSPAARDEGTFNWGSTLWHEMAHSFTLGLSRSRVPRWLTEGLSVYEERRARPGWGQGFSLSFAQAYRRGLILPVSRLNEGFVRPSYPEQLTHSYYEASLVVEWVVQQHGYDAIRRMLRDYGAGRDNGQVFKDVLGLTPEAFDARFDAYVRARFARELAAVAPGPGAPGSYLSKVTRARSLLAAGRPAEARPLLIQARDEFPNFSAPGGPYHLLARIAEQAGDRAGAATELERAAALNESDDQALLHAAALRLQLGDTARAAASLERAIYVYPYDPALHDRLATLEAALHRFDAAVRERRAVLALKPVDQAGAHYRLARALEQAGDRAQARREVLKALEIAPEYAQAQELLLRLSPGAP